MRIVILLIVMGMPLSAFAEGAPFVLWQHQLGGEFFEQQSSLTLTTNGEPILAANIVTKAEIDPATQKMTNRVQAVLIKYAIAGKKAWELKTTGAGTLLLRMPWNRQRDGVLVNGTAEGDVSFGGQVVPLGPGKRNVLISISAQGELRNISEQGPWYGDVHGLKALREAEDRRHFQVPDDGRERLLAARLNSKREPLWITQIADTDSKDGRIYWQNAPDRFGNHYVLVNFHRRQLQFLLVKLDNKGNGVWTKTFTGGSGTRMYRVLTDQKGYLYLVGKTSNLTIDGHSVETEGGTYSQGRTKAFVAKISPAGACQWMVHSGGPGKVQRLTAAVDSHGNIVLAGQLFAYENIEFGNHRIRSNPHGWAPFLTKLNTSGEFQWLRLFTTAESIRSGDTGTTVAVPPVEPNSIAVAPDGKIYLSGQSGGLRGVKWKTEAGELRTISPSKPRIHPGRDPIYPASEVFLMCLEEVRHGAR